MVDGYEWFHVNDFDSILLFEKDISLKKVVSEMTLNNQCYMIVILTEHNSKCQSPPLESNIHLHPYKFRPRCVLRSNGRYVGRTKNIDDLGVHTASIRKDATCNEFHPQKKYASAPHFGGFAKDCTEFKLCETVCEECCRYRCI